MAIQWDKRGHDEEILELTSSIHGNVLYAIVYKTKDKWNCAMYTGTSGETFWMSEDYDTIEKAKARVEHEAKCMCSEMFKTLEIEPTIKIVF